MPNSLQLALRYDMRAPAIVPDSPTAQELYHTAVEQCRWADDHGFETVYLAEHHGAEDGYCPSPLVLGSAIAGVTRRMQIHLSALCLPMHHPLRLAEDVAVLDLIAGPGRLLITAGMGYRAHEFDMFGVEFEERVQVYEKALDVLRQAWTGEEFEFEGKSVQVTPRPATPGGPTIYIGGNAKPSARRAARMGLGYRPATDALYEYYVTQCEERGLPRPEPYPAHGPAFLHVTRDPERAWQQVAPHVMHASNMYANWAKERSSMQVNGYWKSQGSIDELRANPTMWVMTPEELVKRCQAMGSEYELRMPALLGGLPPQLSWESLELFASDVLPRLEKLGLRQPAGVPSDGRLA